MRSVAVLVVALGLLVGACAQPAPAPAPAPAPKPDLAAEEKAIRDLDARWLKAVQARDAKGEAAMFASDGLAYREHNAPLGPAAYEAFETKFFADNPKSTGAWSTNAVRVASSGDFAVQTGEFHNTGLGPKGDGEDKGSFVTVWKKVNGEWKVAHDISATSMPEVPVTKKK
jgi:uncharacterized protein (TIGR02246 family)